MAVLCLLPNPDIVASVSVLIAVAVASIAAFVIIILIRKGVLRRKRSPTQPTSDGLGKQS